MSLSRRKMLTLVGGGTVLAATAGCAAFLTTRTPTKALAPWDLAGNYNDIRLRALSYALLAPNAHNRQPWQAQLVGTDEIRLFRDPTLNLPETDPYSRQLTIGMGCFTELMVQAFANENKGVEVTLFPEGEAETAPVLHAKVRGEAEPDPLFQHVMERRSCKEPFDMTKPVAPETLEKALKFSEGAAGTTKEAEVAKLRELTWEAWQIEAQTPRTHLESVNLFRIGKSEINQNPDGIDLGGPMMDSLKLFGIMSRETAADPEHTAFQQAIEIYREIMSTTPAFVWLTSNGNTRADQINAGRAWVRLNLATTANGLSLHPVSQCLQEYPEMAEPYTQAHTLLAENGETVQMLGRVGYGPQIPRTPRWPLDAKLVNA